MTLGDGVAFTDDTNFGAGGTSVFVRGNGTVIYNGTTDYAGTISINNANFKVNGQIDTATVNVCRNSGFSAQRGSLSGSGTLTGSVFVNSGTISPDSGETLTLGSLTLSSAAPGALGSLVHSTINPSSTALVAVNGSATLAGILEIELDPTTLPGTYTLLTSSGITGTFDSITFTGATPNYTISYLPLGAPTFVQFRLINNAPVADTTSASTNKNTAVVIPLTGSDLDGDPLTFSVVTGPSHGSLSSITSTGDFSAEVTYTPNLNYSGSDSFTFKVNDGTIDSAPALVSLTVINPAPDAPSNLRGIQRKNNFGFEYELYNTLTWEPSPSPDVTGYFLYRDGQKIATLDASASAYQDHNQQRGASVVYSLVAFDDNGNISSSVTVTVP